MLWGSGDSYGHKCTEEQQQRISARERGLLRYGRKRHIDRLRWGRENDKEREKLFRLSLKHLFDSIGS